jgi:CHAT domain-containing protein/tetratricopeptide (TPR) repeat protein
MREEIRMTLKKWLVTLCLGLMTSLFVQAATLEEQAELMAAVFIDYMVAELLEQGQFQQALPFAEEAFKIKTGILGEKHPNTLTSMSHLASVYIELGRLSEALPWAEKCYDFRKELLGEKHPSTLLCLNNLAITYQRLGSLPDALFLYEKGHPLTEEVFGEKHPHTLQIMNNLATIYQDLGHLSKALPLFDKCYSLRKKVLGEKHIATLESLNNLALIYKDLGRLSKALPLSEKAYNLTQEVLGEKHPRTLISLNNLATIYLYLGRFSKALPLLEKGYNLTEEVLGKDNPQTLIVLINSLALIYQNSGSLSKALPLFEKAYDLSKKVLGEKHHKTLALMNNLAMIYRDLGRLEKALPLSKKAYTLSKEVLGENHPQTLLSLNNWALIYQNSGNLSEALSLFEKGYNLSKKALEKKHSYTIGFLGNLATTYQYLGRLEKALPLYEESYHLNKGELGKKHPNTLISMNNLAVIYQDLGRLEEALPLYKKSYSLSKEVLGKKHPHTLSNLYNLAYTYFKQGNINQAIKHFETFVTGVESLRSGEFSAENRQSLFKQWVDGYFGLSDLYTKQSRPQDAFRLAEMSKARTLLESLAAKLAAQQSGLTATDQQQLQDYEARLAFLSNRIAKAQENQRIEEQIALETEKNQLVVKVANFERELIAKYPKYAQLSKVQTISAKEGAKHLPADAVLISYLVDENRVLAFTLQADGTLTAHNLGEIPNLKKDLENYRHQLALSKINYQKESSTSKGNRPIRFRRTQQLDIKLGQQLLAPLFETIKDKPHWIISPSGSLASIPFETLRLKGEQQPVIAKRQISYVQSLSVLALLQKRDQVYQNLENRGTLLAMGAPLYEGMGTAKNQGNPSTVDFNIARQMVRRGGDFRSAYRQLNKKWRNLPGALVELAQLETLFKETNPRIYKQEEATEAKLQSLNQQSVLAQYRYLVFPAHGYLNQEIPALSALVLGQVNNPPEIDGYVTAGEWPGYDLKSDLMVLSACQTGLGEVVSGEGVMGLPYAFYVAGNKNTILTLWSIGDDVTVEFITSFFAKLKNGVGQIEALTATKREFLNRGGRYSNPVYWAAFVLYGV